MLSGRRNKPPRASEYRPVFAVGRPLFLAGSLAKSPGNAAAEVIAFANENVTKGLGSSFGKYPLASRSIRGTVGIAHD